MGQLPETSPAKPASALAKKIRVRHAQTKSPMCLTSEQIAAAKHVAAAKSIGYQTQLRMWIAEGIRREGKRACRGLRICCVSGGWSLPLPHPTDRPQVQSTPVFLDQLP
jgi:hypothetical protein